MHFSFIYPIIAHWTWHREGWLRQQGYYDFAGSGVVHLTGGEKIVVVAAAAADAATTVDVAVREGGAVLGLVSVAFIICPWFKVPVV